MNIDEMKNRISMALKDPILQQGFEIICKENAELKEKVNILDNCDRLGDMITEAYKDQLTKATDLLRKFMKFYERIARECYSKDFQKTLTEAEQFLNEVEK